MASTAQVIAKCAELAHQIRAQAVRPHSPHQGQSHRDGWNPSTGTATIY